MMDLPPEANVIQQRSNPNLAQNALPMIQDLSSVMRTNLGLPGPQGELQQANTKYGQTYQQLREGSLTGAQVTRFYRTWRRLLSAQFRRIQRIGNRGNALTKSARTRKQQRSNTHGGER